jgi:hypothetical protein
MSASRGTRALSGIIGVGNGVKISSADDGAWNGGRGARNHKVAKSESLEYINGRQDGLKDVPLEIWQDVEVHVQKFDAEDGESIRRKEMYDGVKNGDGDLGFKTKTVVTASAV